MDSSDAIQFLVLIVLICLSAFFSSAETSMTTANKIRIQTLAEQGNKKAKTLLKVTGNSGKMLSTILIGNNLSISGLLPCHIPWLSACSAMPQWVYAPVY